MNPAVEAIDGEGVDAAANAEDAPMGGIGLKQEEGMNLRICRLLSITAFVSCFVASAQTLAQNAYITNSASGRLAIVDTQKDEIFSNPFIGEGGLGMAVSPDGSRAFIGYRNFRHVSVWNTGIQNPVPSRREFSRLADIPVGGGPLGLASQDRNKVYVANERTGTLSVITATDAVTYKLTATLPIGCDPRGVAVSPDGSKVYVVNEGSSSVSVIDTATNTVIPTGTSLTGLDRPVSFGAFIGPGPPRFIGTPGFSNCVGQSIAAVDQKFGDRNSAAADLRFPDARALENAIVAFCQ